MARAKNEYQLGVTLWSNWQENHLQTRQGQEFKKKEEEEKR
jgi:hypothetical protein